MGLPAENNDNSTTSNIAANDQFFDSKYDINRRSKATGSIVISDIHGNYNSLNNVYSIAKNNNLNVIIDGDFVNDYAFQEFASELGYKSQNELFFEYASQKLSDQDLQTLYFKKNYEQVQSLDPFLEQVPSEHKIQAKKQLENILNYSNSDAFGAKFNALANDFGEEMQDEVIKNQYSLNVLYHMFMDLEAQRLAQFINHYEIDTIFNPGNHENSYFVKQVRNHLENPEKIIDVANHKGYITVEQDNGQEMTIAGMTNCVQTMPYLQEVVLSPDEYNILTNHMSIDEVKSQTILQGEADDDHYKSLESIIKTDEDYKRMIEGEKRDLDVFLSHGQIGKVLINNGKGYDVPYFGVAAYMSGQAQLTVEGHIHSKYDGKNSFGNDMIRAAGEDAAIIRKNDDGEMEWEWIKIDENFNGNHHNPIDYSKEDLKIEVEKQLENIIGLIGDGSSSED